VKLVKNTPLRVLFNSLLGVWKCEQMQSFVCDIVLVTQTTPKKNPTMYKWKDQSSFDEEGEMSLLKCKIQIIVINGSSQSLKVQPSNAVM